MHISVASCGQTLDEFGSTAEPILADGSVGLLC